MSLPKSWPTTATNFSDFSDRILRKQRDGARPHKIGYGEAACSSCVDLIPRRFVIWDTNGWYRELGVSTDASRLDLRRAYQAKEGWRSARLTHILKQLLDADVRARYDATPLGMKFRDKYVIEDEWLQMKQAMCNKMAEFARLGYRGLTEEDALRELQIDDPDFFSDFSIPDLDPSEDRGHDDRPPWGYAYYLWESDADDTPRLREWQETLISALANGRDVVRFAVGFHGDESVAMKVEQVGYQTVVFLHEAEQPQESLAALAARRVVQIQHQHREGIS